MSCPTIRDIYEYIEGGLSPERDREMERHLSFCPGCRRAVEERKLLAGAVSGLPPFAVPDDFTDRVMTRVASLKIKRPAWLIILLSGTAGLAILSFMLMASGGSLLELITRASHSLWGYVKTGAVLAAKVATILNLAVTTLRPLLEAGTKGLSLLTSLVHPGIQALILILALGAAVSLFLGMRKKLSLGD